MLIQRLNENILVGSGSMKMSQLAVRVCFYSVTGQGQGACVALATLLCTERLSGVSPAPSPHHPTTYHRPYTSI